MKPILDRKNNLVNLGNSILRNYEIPTFHSSMQAADELLDKHSKHVCLILLDGFGRAIMEKNKAYCPFIYKHIVHPCKSIFPPTTVAATNGLLTAKYPTENGYCGWTQYFKDLGKYVNVFPSRVPITNELITPAVTDTYFDKETIITRINKAGKYKAHAIMSINYEVNGETDLDRVFTDADATMDDFDFTYLYVTDPDHTMHGFGTTGHVVEKIINRLDNYVKKLVESNPETLFLLIADHGMVDTTNIYIEDFPDFYNSLEDKLVFIEGRFATVRVKDEKAFLKAYHEDFEDYFILMTKQEMIDAELLGPKENINPICYNTLGDYFLLSKDRYTLANTRGFVLIGNHAGVTEDETNINLCAFNN